MFDKIQHMMEKKTADLSEYRFQKAQVTLKAARLMMNNELYDSALNRLYYSVFYAANALLVKNGIDVKSHEYVFNKFNEMFIYTGLIPKKFGYLFNELYEKRQTGDYQDLYDFDYETIDHLFEPVESFIKLIQTYV
jgi:uncharacterized protein